MVGNTKLFKVTDFKFSMSEQDKEQPKKKLADIFQSILSDRAFILAVILIIPFIFFTAYIIIFDKLETFKDVSAVWGAWVGSVIGYFFGSRQVDALIQKIDGIMRLSEQRVKELEESRRNYEKATEDIRYIYSTYDQELAKGKEIAKAYNKAVDDITLVVNNYSQHLPQDLAERLKSEYM